MSRLSMRRLSMSWLCRTAARGPGALMAARRACAAWRALLAVNAPPSGRPALRSGNYAPDGAYSVCSRGAAPAPLTQPELSRVPVRQPRR